LLLHFFIFDLLILRRRDVMAEPLLKRRAMIEKHVLPTLADPIRYSPILEASLPNLIHSVKEQGLEGIVAKRRDSKYEPGLRSGAWQKMRVNRGQDLVIAGYTPSLKNFDALIIGYHEGEKLLYAARTRSGFTTASRAELFKRIRPLEIKDCPFANLPERHAGRWGAGLTVAKMAECHWLRPVLVGQFEFVEWTAENHLRHAKFVGLRADKNPK
jgi:ATP-dependent DNA ligase